MFKRLEIENAFKHKLRVVDFQKGLTAIFGPNESGKSMIFELAAFALFGTQALRGKTDDYKKMKITLDFEVNGVAYRVQRSTTKALLLRAGVEAASGTKPVNLAILNVLGYGYSVYQIANCAHQRKLTQLGDMRPTERKKLVDDVVGLGVIDKVIADIQKRATDSRNQLATTDARITGTESVMGTQPVQPEGYLSVGARQELRVAHRLVHAEREKLQAVLNLQPPVDPRTCEVATPDMSKKAELEASYQLALQQNSRKAFLEGTLASYRVPELTLAEIDMEIAKINAKTDWLQKLSQYNMYEMQRPRIGSSLEEVEELWELNKKWQQREAYLELRKHALTCPNCDHSFVPNAELGELDEATLNMEKPTPVSFDGVRAWEAFLQVPVVAHPGDAPEEPKYSYPSLESMQHTWSRSEEFAAMRVELETTQWLDVNQLGQELNILLNQSAAYQRWGSLVETWNAHWTRFNEHTAKLAGLQEELFRVSIVEGPLFVACELYESQVDRYQQLESSLAFLRTQAEAIKNAVDQYEAAKEAMREARSTIKQHLVPSLNKVASALLAQMTGGERAQIHIDEDFNITVDGQELNTLSGSGQSVSNLAIRIALGQVLINKKFSIFLADEIDGDMDPERAQYTAECLQKLTKHIDQVVLISHKRPTADHYIELGK
jgi:DNA repair protein SbcC/Rad50